MRAAAGALVLLSLFPIASHASTVGTVQPARSESGSAASSDVAEDVSSDVSTTPSGDGAGGDPSEAPHASIEDEAAELEALTRELAAELGAEQPQREGAPGEPTAPAEVEAPADAAPPSYVSDPDPSRGGSGLNRVLALPDLSAILTTGLFWFSERPTPRFPAHEPIASRGGLSFQLQELELALQSAIDPYVRGDIFLALGLTGIEIEEAFLTTLALPGNLQMRAGWFYAPFGRFGQTHFLETQPFVDMPLPNRRLFGGEQLRGLGVELSWLAPLPWFLTVTVDAMTANNEVSFGLPVSESSGLADFLTVARVEQFFDLDEAWSLQWGLTAAQGPNLSGGPTVTANNRTLLGGTDVYLRWRDPGSLRYVALQAEYLLRQALIPGGRVTEGGAYLQVEARLDRNWQLAARVDAFGLPSDLEGGFGFAGELAQWLRPSAQRRASLAASYYPSERQRLRLQWSVDQLMGNDALFASDHPAYVAGRTAVHEVLLQYQFVMGAHGAHPF